jgi:hypothetical protein
MFKNNLSRTRLREFAEGKPVDKKFRKLVGQYYALADQYRIITHKIIKEISPLLEPRYQLSLEIIFNLYLMVFERINLQDGLFTTEELTPTPDETRERVYRTIIEFNEYKK